MSDAQIEALAVGTRRQIFMMLTERPRSVQELADRLPVSRPAVSQHLKKLVAAGLARSTTIGNRNVYAPDPEGVRHIRDWADRLWSSAFERFADFVETESKEKEMPETIEPILKTLTLSVGPDEAFDRFTRQIDQWWPTETHSVTNDARSGVTLEPGVGGRLFETGPDGGEHTWGRVTVWDQGQRVAFTWHPGQPPKLGTHVEVSFRATAQGTELILIHTGWDVRGDTAGEVRAGYVTGWDMVLHSYVETLQS